jgi:hypothetical protein
MHGIAHKACLENSMRQKEETEIKTVISREYHAPIVPFNQNYSEQVQFQCPFCKATTGYRVDTKVSTGGWLGCILTIFIFPLNFFFLLIQDKHYSCRTCGMKLG